MYILFICFEHARIFLLATDLSCICLDMDIHSVYFYFIAGDCWGSPPSPACIEEVSGNGLSLLVSMIFTVYLILMSFLLIIDLGAVVDLRCTGD